MSGPEPISGVYRRPFDEQVAFFRGKLGNLVPTQRWDDMLGEAHDTGFMVAGATSADLLTDLGAAVDKAISEGKGIDAFRKDFDAIVAKNGWTGWTGEGSVKGEAWRVGTIFRTNVYSSYAAGRFAQLQAGNFKFWVYRHGGSREPRPEHLSWDGLVLPPDHEFWTTHYPPSDWGCSCYVIGAHTEASARAMGGDPAKKLPANWKQRDPKTGAPVGIGRGWAYAPGRSVAQLVSAIAGKIGSWDYQVAKAFMSALPEAQASALGQAYRALPSAADDARQYARQVFEPKPDLPELPPQRTLGLVPSDQSAKIAQETGIAIDGYDFSFDRDAVLHVIKNHGDDAIQRSQGQRGVTASDFSRLPEVLSSPDTIVGGGKTGLGEQAVEYRKVIDGETYVAVMAVRGKRRRTLALKTFYIKLRGK